MYDTKSYQILTLAPKIKINEKEKKSEKEIENRVYYLQLWQDSRYKEKLAAQHR